jgi:hypothetical protein
MELFLKLTAVFFLSILTLNSSFAATPTACAYDYWPEADMYRVIKESAQDIKKCKGQLPLNAGLMFSRF